ncbi:MAG: thiamine pyrophosphate-binding protein [Halanaeroarchaeum sp.]
MADAERPGAEYVYEALREAGVDLLVGLPGTQTLPLDRIVANREEIEYLMARHETAIPHVAWGHYETGGDVAATLTVPGPGEANAAHGLYNAYEDGVPIIHLAADVNPGDRGKRPIHEIDPGAFDAFVKENVTVSEAVELGPELARGIEVALSPPRGPVRIGVPAGLLASDLWTPTATVDPERIDRDNGGAYDRAADLLAVAKRPVVYAGKELRRDSGGPRIVRDLASALDAPVLVSLKGKGVFPEDHPRFVGVTGEHLPAGGWKVLDRADAVLALGTDFNGITTADWTLPMGEVLVHVTAREFNPAYDPDVKIRANAAEAGEAILERLGGETENSWDGERIGRAVRAEYEERLADSGLFAPSKAYTVGVYRELRERLPRETVVTTDIGGHRLWATQTFAAYDPETYVTAGSWAGMGVGLPAAMGAKLANPDRPVLCLTGDGGLMMCIAELHTAVERDLDVAIVVLNDADYGIVSQLADFEADRPFRWDSPDFAAIAEGFGCRATRVESAGAAADAVEAALEREGGPELVEVVLERDDPSVYDAAGDESALDLPE